MNKVIFLVIIILSMTSCKQMAKHDMINFDLKHQFKDYIKEDRGTFIQHKYSKNGSMFIINDYKEHGIEKIKVIMDNKIMVINSLYEVQKSPYPGAVSNIIACPKKYSPVVKQIDDEKILKETIILFANQFNFYGACSEEAIEKISGYALIICKEKNQLFEVKLLLDNIDSRSEIAVFLESLNCK